MIINQLTKNLQRYYLLIETFSVVSRNRCNCPRTNDHVEDDDAAADLHDDDDFDLELWTYKQGAAAMTDYKICRLSCSSFNQPFGIRMSVEFNFHSKNSTNKINNCARIGISELNEDVNKICRFCDELMGMPEILNCSSCCV